MRNNAMNPADRQAVRSSIVSCSFIFPFANCFTLQFFIKEKVACLFQAIVSRGFADNADFKVVQRESLLSCDQSTFSGDLGSSARGIRAFNSLTP
jgi:hypothetical protein